MSFKGSASIAILLATAAISVGQGRSHSSSSGGHTESAPSRSFNQPQRSSGGFGGSRGGSSYSPSSHSSSGRSSFGGGGYRPSSGSSYRPSSGSSYRPSQGRSSSPSYQSHSYGSSSSGRDFGRGSSSYSSSSSRSGGYGFSGGAFNRGSGSSYSSSSRTDHSYGGSSHTFGGSSHSGGYPYFHSGETGSRGTSSYHSGAGQYHSTEGSYHSSPYGNFSSHYHSAESSSRSTYGRPTGSHSGGGFGGSGYGGGGFHGGGARGGGFVRGGDRVYQRPGWGGGWRDGYEGWGYHSHFSFGFYLDSPFIAPCFISPWYYYSCLPPYIPAADCVVVPDYYCDWNAGAPYQYDPGPAVSYATPPPVPSIQAPPANQDPSLDTAIEDIDNTFRNQIPDAIESLIPMTGSVGIFSDGQYQYSLKADEFRQMISDAVTGAQTETFDVTDVRRTGEVATVHCTHVVKNKTGDVETVYQTYHLHRAGDRFVITDFMTSHQAS